MSKFIFRFTYYISILAMVIAQVGVWPVVIASAADDYTFIVNSSVDAVDAEPGDGICETETLGECTLRAAIQEANALGGSTMIELQEGVTYKLTNYASPDLFLPVIFAVITINGNASTITPQASGESFLSGGIFYVDVDGVLTLNAVTIQNGSLVESSGAGVYNLGALTVANSTFSTNKIFNGSGGAIANAGTASVTDSVFDSNWAIGSGGAIYNEGQIIIAKSTFTGNFAAGMASQGGAIYNSYNDGQGEVDIIDSVIKSNTATDNGGGLYNAGTANLVDSTVGNNKVTETGAQGAGIFNLGTLSAIGTTISNNTTSKMVNGWGGGFTNTGTADFTNVTVSGNFAYSFAGGIENSGVLTIVNSTIADNTGYGGNNGIVNGFNAKYTGTGTVILANTIVANNFNSNPLSVNCFGTIASNGYNLTDDDTCAVDGPGDLINTDPLLRPLSDNGGPTQTMALLGGSPAIDAGTHAGCALADQRGVVRPQGAACDIGAYEAEYNLFLVTNTDDGGPGSLRQAILDANAFASINNRIDEIHFDIFTEGSVATIAPTSALPAITEPVIIDGTTQPGAGCAEWPPKLEVEIDGINAGSGVSGFTLTYGASGSTVRGLVINRFGLGASDNENGITLLGSNNNTIQCNFLGVSADGMTARGNGHDGIAVFYGSSTNHIGGTELNQRNLISGNHWHGVDIAYDSPSNNTVQGNYIGTDVTGTTDLGNGYKGVLLNYDTHGTAVTGNTIAFNNDIGVALANGAIGNSIQYNAIFDNNGLGIDIVGMDKDGNDVFGVTHNHEGFAAGPNNYQNFPVMTLATINGDKLRVKGWLETDTPNQEYTIDLYSNPVCDSTWFGEGQTYLGYFTVTTDATGTATFDTYGDETIAANLTEPMGISATTTGPSGTSEFSYCRPVSTINLNWVQAQQISNGSVTQQYITDNYQEKWFKIDANPDERIRVTLNSIPGSAISLHTDPRLIYDELVAGVDPTEVSARSAESGFIPSGTLSSGKLKRTDLPVEGVDTVGYLPSGTLPSGKLPSGALPSGTLPSGTLPSGTLPPESLPSGTLPSGTLPSGTLPSGTLPSGTLPSGTLPSGTLPSGTLDAYNNAARWSLIGISMDPHATTQTVERNTYDYQGALFIRIVTPFNVASPFTLSVDVQGGVCIGISSEPGPADLVNGNPPQVIAGPALVNGAYNTLILTDSARLPGTPTEINAALNDLRTLAARPDVNATVIDLSDARYQRVAWANEQANNYRACPAAKNIVAREIKAVIDKYRKANHASGGRTLKYIVLAGGASVIPYYQVPDLADKGNEKEYRVPVAPSTPSDAGLQNNLVQGQDYYGSRHVHKNGDLTLIVPDLAVGRLVETAADISNIVDNYIAIDGTLTPESALVTGYDFIADGASAIANSNNFNELSVEPLIQPEGHRPTDPDAWTIEDLRNALTSSQHDIVMFSGHFSAGDLKAADYHSTVTVAEMVSWPVDFQDTLILVLGCHGGYTIPTPDMLTTDTLLIGLSPDPDWAKYFLRQGSAGFIASTGYAYGEQAPDIQDYGEQLFLSLAQQFPTDGSSITLGEALMAAKMDYLSLHKPHLDGTDQKTLTETTLYGLPMLKVQFPASATPQRLNHTVAQAGLTEEFAMGLFEYSGLVEFPNSLNGLFLTVNPSLTEHTVELSDGESTLTTTYYSGQDGTFANPYEPLYPQEVLDVSRPDAVLRGVAFLGGKYTDHAEVIPLTSAPAMELSSAHLSFNSQVFYPNQMWESNYYAALNGGPTRLFILPAQFRSRVPGALDGTLRTYTQLNLMLLYLPTTADQTLLLSAGPNILGASAENTEDGVVFTVNAMSDGSAGLQNVWVLYTGRPDTTYYGEWLPLGLTQDPNDPTVWMGTLPLAEGAHADDLLFMVQAVGGGGLTRLATNGGQFYSVTPAVVDEVKTTLKLTAPLSGTYRQQASFALQLSDDTGAPLPDQLVTLNINGQETFATTDAFGAATIMFAPTSIPRTEPYLVQAQFQGVTMGAVKYLASNDYAQFTINKDTTTLTLAPATTIIDGATGQVNQITPIVAALRDSWDRQLRGLTVVFVVHNATHVFTKPVIADYQGEAWLGAVPLLPGTYSVDAYFYGNDYYEGVKADSVTLMIGDDIPPTITASAEKADGSIYVAGTWTNQTVTVHFTCDDVGSGVASCPDAQIFSADGIFTASGTVRDYAGNATSTSFGPIQIDKTAPALSPRVSPNPVYLNGLAVVTSGAADVGSGLASQSCGKLDTSTVGFKIVTCTATDQAGNTASAVASYNVIYRFDGFLPPINDTGHALACGPYCPISIFKGGSTVPVKFQLKDANGKVVQSTQLPVWLTPQMGAALTSNTVNNYPAPISSNTTYQRNGQHYSFNWVTKGLATGYYWQIGVMLDDGQIYYVTIILR